MASKLDKELGLDRPITRRDFIHGSSLVVGGTLAGCSTPGAVPDYGFDGMRCDVEGNLYVTRHGKGTVVKDRRELKSNLSC